MLSTPVHNERLPTEETRDCSQDHSSDEGEVEAHPDNVDNDFIRNRKERSTVLVRRFCKNNQKACV